MTDERKKAMDELATAFLSGDQNTGAVAIIKVLGFLFNDIGRIADAAEKIAANTAKTGDSNG